MSGLRWFVFVSALVFTGLAMLGWRWFVLLSALVFAGVAYLVHLAYRVPIPDGISQPDIVRPALAMGSLFRYVGMTADRLGYNGPATLSAVHRHLGFLRPTPPHYDVTTKDMDFGGVPVRVYTPTSRDQTGTETGPRRTVLYLHGGGWVSGSVDVYDDLCQMMCQELNAMLVSVDYRLSPAHVFPAAIEDSFAAAEYLFAHAQSLDVDTTRIAIIGDSAGGTMAAAVTQRLKNRHITPLPKLQALIYPPLQAIDFDTPSMRANSEKGFLTRDFMVWFYNHYLFGNQRNFEKMRANNHTDLNAKQTMRSEYMKPEDLPQDEILRDYVVKPLSDGDIEFWQNHHSVLMNPECSPLMTKAGDLAGLPHTFILSCQHDVLRDDAFHYAA